MAKKRAARRTTGGVILAIDQGTTGTKAVLIDAKLRVLAEHSREFPQHFPRPGWVEHDLDDIYESVRTAVRGALHKARIKPTRIAAVGIANQRETTVIWERDTGKPIHRAIVWQDRRTAPMCQELKDRGLERTVRRKTGLVLDPYFAGTKIAWLLDHVKGARSRAKAGRLVFGTIDTYLLWRLTNGRSHATDVSNASRTLLMDLKHLNWSRQLCDAFDIPMSLLPEIRSNDAIFGHTDSARFLPDNIPIASVVGDQQSALFGQACFRAGEAKCTYGTGAFLVVNTGDKIIRSRHGALSTAAWRMADRPCYALEGSAFVAGAIVQWLRDGLKVIDSAPDVEALAASVPDSGGAILVPALTGLGAPHWDPDARGLLSGVTRGTTVAHLARAALEGIALQIHDLVKAMEADLGAPVRHLKVDGGASLNNLLMQFQADILRRHVIRPRNISTTALGTALLAGLTIGLVPSLGAIRKIWTEDRDFRAQMKPGEAADHVKRWELAVRRARLR